MPYANKEQQKRAQHESYLRNKEKVKEGQRRSRAAARSYIQKKKVESGCIECGETHVAVLVFHHRDPKEKEITSVGMMQNKWGRKRIDEELAKCDVMCANCHRKLHWRLDHPDDPEGLQILE